MREENNKAESVPARSGARRPRRSRSREAFKQRQKDLAENRAQERGAQENKTQESRIQETGGAGENRTGKNKTGDGPFDKILSRKAAALVLILAGVVLAGVYVYKALGYRNTYFPHTVINGMDVSGKTAEEVKELMASGVKGYGLVLKLRQEKDRKSVV